MRRLTVSLAVAALLGCGPSPQPQSAPPPPAAGAVPAVDPAAAARLAAVLEAQPEAVKRRYRHRHPQETMAFFGIEPGMTVVEALPGGGWYSRILIPYLGTGGRLIGADYALEMYRHFDFGTAEFLGRKQNWVNEWPASARKWRDDDGAAVDAFVFGRLPETMHGGADAVLFIRALHNLARFEDEGGYLTKAIRDAYDVLKPGGIVGVVQHHARPDMPEEWAGGRHGYLKRQFVIDAMQRAGFEYVASSAINANERDRPTVSDTVWRLPPALATSRDDPELLTRMRTIGESNRMTLRFRKPGA